MDDIYNSGISAKDWYPLRDAVLGAKYHKGNELCAWYEDLPEHLKKHEIGILVYKSLYENNLSALPEAADKLVGGNNQGQAFFVLEKT